MSDPNLEDVKTRLLWILHRGWVEARLLAQAGRNQQLFDLADTLEIVPGCVAYPDLERFDLIMGCLQDYQKKYDGLCFNYLDQYHHEPPPKGF